MISHPYIKYGIALIMEENSLHSQNDISLDLIVNEIEKGLKTFRLKPSGNWEGKESIQYIYTEEDGRAQDYIFLSPHILTTDIQAKNLKLAAHNYINNSSSANNSFLFKKEKIGMSEVPIAGEFSTFSKTIGRGSPKSTKMIQGLGLVTTLTQYKPSLSNTCLIPDLSISDLVDFITIFKRLLFTATESLFIGKVKVEKTKNGEKYIPKRPKIQNGNFSNAPRSEALGSIALLGAIGELGKEEEYSDIVKNVLDKLKGTSIYLIKYGNANSFSFNHHVIDLAKSAKLCSVVDSIYYTKLYNQDRRSWDNVEYQKFDMFAFRFLHLFNRPSFKDFMSFRAEYPSQTEILFNTYFNKMENIDKKIIESAKSLGQWLNWVAYKYATENIEGQSELKQKKAKVLIELESSIFAAKSADALIAQTITRAGRLSNSDAPAEASLFIEATLTGLINLNVAKNILVAYSRIKSEKNSSIQDKTDDFLLEEIANEDYSHI